MLDSDAPKTVALCAVFRNEGTILDEFISFHYMMGVGHFVLYDDHSVDQVGPTLITSGNNKIKS